MICHLCANENLKLYYKQGNNNEYSFYKCPVCKLVNYDISSGLDQKKFAKRNPNPVYKQKSEENKAQSYAFNKKIHSPPWQIFWNMRMIKMNYMILLY